MAKQVKQLAQGLDTSLVVDKGPVQSIGQELTFLPQTSMEQLQSKLQPLVADLVHRITRDQERNQRCATHVTVRWALHNFATKFASTSCKVVVLDAKQSNMQQRLLQTCTTLLQKQLQVPFAVTRIAISVSQFVPITSKSSGTLLEHFGVKRQRSENEQDVLQASPTKKMRQE